MRVEAEVDGKQERRRMESVRRGEVDVGVERRNDQFHEVDRASER